MTRIFGIALTLWICQAAEAAETSRFAVVDLVPSVHTEKLVAEVEREMVRLDPAAKAIDDPVMRRLLANGEAPADTGRRLLTEAQEASKAGDCTRAVNRARMAEPLILAHMAPDDEREPLKALYKLLVLCEEKLGNTAGITTAAVRLRSMMSVAPDDFPLPLWEQYVAGAVPGQPTAELYIDSDPPNGQVSVNFRGEGVTPRTLKVAPGVIYVEIFKEGYKKAFRAVDVKAGGVARALMRLVPRAQDRMEQAQAQVPLLRRGETERGPALLSRIAQLARVETLVLLEPAAGRVKIRFFDAERGIMAGDAIDSAYDQETGKVAALASRPSPGAGSAVSGNPAVTTKTPVEKPAETSTAALPEARAQDQYATFKPKRAKEGAPWYAWVIAGAVGVAFGVFVFTDRTKTADTVAVRARWSDGGK